MKFRGVYVEVDAPPHEMASAVGHSYAQTVSGLDHTTAAEDRPYVKGLPYFAGRPVPPVNVAARALLDELSARPFKPSRAIVQDFQFSYNRTAFPIATGSGTLRPDGWYGQLTTNSLQNVIGAWASRAAQQGGAVVSAGFNLGHFLGDVAKFPVTAPVTLVTHPKQALHDVEKAVKDAEPILSMVQGVVSMVPGVGTGFSAAIGAATGLLDGGGLLGAAIKAAYGAIPIPDGMRQITDPIVDAVIALGHHKSLTDTLIYVARERLPGGLPRNVFDTLIRVVLHKKPAAKDPQGAKDHYVTQYTKGIGPALAKGLDNHPAAAALANTPSPNVTYAPLAATPKPQPAPVPLRTAPAT